MATVYLCFFVLLIVAAGAAAAGEEASCGASASLLQRRSLVEPGTAPPSEASEQQQLAAAPAGVEEDVVKFLAGVPVYNYGYVRHLEQCEEVADGDCELKFLQANVGSSQASEHPVRGRPDWEHDLLNNGDGHHAHGEMRPASPSEDGSDSNNRRRKFGKAREWLVKMRDGVSDQVLHTFCDVLPGNAKCTAQGHPSEGGIPLVVVTGTEDELEEQLRRQTGKTDYVEPDIPMDAIPEVRSKEEEDKEYKTYFSEGGIEELQVNAERNTSHVGAQGHSITGNRKPSSWGLDRIDNRYGLDETFAIGTEGGKNVHVYVADTGIRTTHQDFGSRALATLEIRKGIIHECEPSNGKCAQDDNGHGTHAAATVAGKRYGVAKSVTLHSIKILSETGRGKMSYLIQALDWVATKGLRPAIFTASVGGPGNPPSVVKAIEAASAAGVTVIVAAGNFGRDACGFSPAHVKAAITVGATENSNDLIAAYSNFGRCVDIFAPGSDIHSAGRLSDTAKATMSGTSMATPHVAGAAALLLGEDHTRTPEEVSLLLKARATQGTVKGSAGGSPSMMLYTASLEEGDEIWWQSVWVPSWWKLFRFTGWADLLRPGPMKELMAEAFVCCLFLISLSFMMTRCVRFLSLPPGACETR